MSQVISLRYPASIHPFAFIGGLILVIGLVAVMGLGLATGPEPATTQTAVGSVSSAPIPLESEYLRSISAGWGKTAPVAAPIPLESEYLRSISAGW